jgi:hypothetical protein
MENNTNKNTNTNKDEKNEKAARFQAERLEKAVIRFEAAKVYTEKKTGAVSELLRQAKSIRISAMNVEELAGACVNRAKELSKIAGVNKDLLRYLKAEIGNAIRANIGAEKLALFVDCNRGEFKVDMAIKYACAASRNEDIKAILKAMKKASK